MPKTCVLFLGSPEIDGTNVSLMRVEDVLGVPRGLLSAVVIGAEVLSKLVDKTALVLGIERVGKGGECGSGGFGPDLGGGVGGTVGGHDDGSPDGGREHASPGL